MVSVAPVVIDDMTLDDIDAVQEVERSSFPVPWPANAFRHELTQNRNARYVVARSGEHIVGYAGLWLMVDEAHITTFAVHPHLVRPAVRPATDRRPRPGPAQATLREKRWSPPSRS